MNNLIDRRSKLWAAVAAVGGLGLFLGLELLDEPGMTLFDMALEILDLIPIVATSVGVALLFQITGRQREEHQTLIRDLEVARVQGQRWRSEARVLLNGLGDAIDAQFSRWKLTEAEREVALLLLKGLSLKEVATVRATNERTVRTQARALYAKAGLSGRAALSAFFLEDLLAPIEGLESADPHAEAAPAQRKDTRTIQ
jgi:DNA-binding CsgD family transcriptional regulator